MEAFAFTSLESAVVDWFVLFYKDKALTGQLRSARVTKREWTEVGWYVDLFVSDTTAHVDAIRLGHGGWPIEGPQVRSLALPQDAGVILWGKQGVIDCIEMFAYGSEFPYELGQFKLITPMNLNPKP